MHVRTVLLLFLGIVLMDLFMKTNFPRTPLSEMFVGHMYPQSRPILPLPIATIFTTEWFSSAIHEEARHVTQPDRGPLGSLFPWL